MLKREEHKTEQMQLMLQRLIIRLTSRNIESHFPSIFKKIKQNWKRKKMMEIMILLQQRDKLT